MVETKNFVEFYVSIVLKGTGAVLESEEWQAWRQVAWVQALRREEPGPEEEPGYRADFPSCLNLVTSSRPTLLRKKRCLGCQALPRGEFRKRILSQLHSS